MMKFMQELNEAIEKKLPLNLYIKETDTRNYEFYDVLDYNEKTNRYEGVYGHIPMEKMPLILMQDKSVDHIKLEVCK